MKRLLPLYSILCLLLISTGCSKDDNSPTDNPNPTPTLILSSTATDIIVGDEIQFTTRSTKELISDAKITELSKGVVLSSNKWKATDVGTFTFKASKEGYKESEVVTVHVKDKLKTKGVGNFTYLGKEYKIETAKLILRTVDEMEGKSVWNLELYNYTDNIGVNYRFSTALEFDANNKAKVMLPTTENMEYVTLAIMKDMKNDTPDIIALAFRDLEINIKIDRKTSGFDNMEITGTTPNISESPFALSYKGELETVGVK